MRLLSALLPLVISLDQLVAVSRPLRFGSRDEAEVGERPQMDLPIRGVSTVSCWMDTCKAACESRGEQGVCKYRCHPKLQKFDRCVTKCVCSGSNVWPEDYQGQATIACDTWGCAMACVNMKKTTGYCEIRKRKKPQGTQASAHCHCVK